MARAIAAQTIAGLTTAARKVVATIGVPMARHEANSGVGLKIVAPRIEALTVADQRVGGPTGAVPDLAPLAVLATDAVPAPTVRHAAISAPARMVGDVDLMEEAPMDETQKDAAPTAPHLVATSVQVIVVPMAAARRIAARRIAALIIAARRIAALIIAAPTIVARRIAVLIITAQGIKGPVAAVGVVAVLTTAAPIIAGLTVEVSKMARAAVPTGGWKTSFTTCNGKSTNSVKQFANCATIKIAWNMTARETITLAITIPEIIVLAINVQATVGPNSVDSAAGLILLDRLHLAPVDLSAVAPSGVLAMVLAAHRFASRPTWPAAADAMAAHLWDLLPVDDKIKSAANAASTMTAPVMMVRVKMVRRRDVAVEAAA